jgi:hypothetical protein
LLILLAAMVPYKTEPPVAILRFTIHRAGYRPYHGLLSISSKESTVLITILVVLAIIVLALFIWRNFVGRSV